jgi:CRISPR-associated protein Csa3
MLYIITLGFDEKFALRAIVSRGLRENDEILVLMPTASDKYSQSKAEKAFDNLKQFIEKVQATKIKRVELDVKDLARAVSGIKKEIKESYQKEVYANLSGGMRILIIEVILALILLGIEAEIDIDLEDMGGTVTLYSSYFMKEYLDWIDHLILLSLLGDEKDIGQITEKIKKDLADTDAIPPSRVTVWRRILLLEKKMLVKHSSHGKTRLYSLTKKGQFLAYVIA